MDLNRVSFNQHRHESLDTQPVQSGGAIKQDRPVFDHVFQDVPHFRPVSLHHALGVLYVRGNAQDRQPVHHKGFEQLQGHSFGQAALVHLQFGAHHDYRPAAVIDPLAQQVLAEAALLAS